MGLNERTQLLEAGGRTGGGGHVAGSFAACANKPPPLTVAFKRAKEGVACGWGEGITVVGWLACVMLCVPVWRRH